MSAEKGDTTQLGVGARGSQEDFLEEVFGPSLAAQVGLGQMNRYQEEKVDQSRGGVQQNSEEDIRRMGRARCRMALCAILRSLAFIPESVGSH